MTVNKWPSILDCIITPQSELLVYPTRIRVPLANTNILNIQHETVRFKYIYIKSHVYGTQNKKNGTQKSHVKMGYIFIWA